MDLSGSAFALGRLPRYAFGVGTWGVGGPVAPIGQTYRDLVKGRGWLSEADYKEDPLLAQSMPESRLLLDLPPAASIKGYNRR
jgi:hypothetical protein